MQTRQDYVYAYYVLRERRTKIRVFRDVVRRTIHEKSTSCGSQMHWSEKPGY